MQPLANQRMKRLPATVAFALYALAWMSACIHVYLSQTTFSGEYGSGSTYSVPVVPLTVGLIVTVLYWLGLGLLAIFVKEQRRFFVMQLVPAVALALALSTAFWAVPAH